ncbi:hypothetical protein [Swingsia samuiensis]|uniref:Histidine kinase n=1 Tax=Swingsia samuiensis TaxID=1293412 RepID=A0A4Y6UL58_9PROT|nr:hypothetical protein [Swingsia samuiensis]QDH17530.1 hypothetical protein E3D00_08125 [Swingsia samuiensis]
MTSQSTANHDKTKKLRHDLRNALSPALLCADILTAHPDATVQKNAYLITSALENALALLKQTTSSQ